MERHWAINGRFLSQNMTGVQRYAHEIVRGLDGLLAGDHALARNLQIELLLPPDAAPPADLQHISIRTVGRSRGHIWEQAVLPAATKGHLLSLCNTGPVMARRQIVCMHDANTRICPQSYSLPFRSLYRVLLPVLGRSVRRIATVSNYSAEALVRYGICKPGKVAVIPNGHEHATRWAPRHSATTRIAAGPETIVLIGSSVPHKNARLLLGMAERLAGAGMRIAVVGARDARVFGREEPAHSSDNVAWVGRLSDAEFAALLEDCMCLAFPSFAEGFGLPPLEAMARHCPVVVSDRTSMPEVCGDAALYAAPDNADAWFDSFMRLRTTPGLRTELIRRGQARLTRYRWGDSAELYLRIMAVIDGVDKAKARASAP